MTRTTYVFCKKKKKMVVKGTEWQEPSSRGPMVIGPLEPFRSPITGEMITSRERLKQHNREHGVTNIADYSPEYIEQRAKERHARMTGQTAEATAERKRLIMQAMQRGK